MSHSHGPRACTPVAPAPQARLASAATVLALCAGCGLTGHADAQARTAQDFPTRPIRIIIGFTPGGQPDIFSRLIASRLTDVLGQNVLVDNRPGAGGTIGAKLVADAVPDGHTLLAVSGAALLYRAWGL